MLAVMLVAMALAVTPRGALAAGPPYIAAFLPATVTTAGGSAVTIFGSGFQYGATVTFGGTPGYDVLVLSSTQMVVTTPAGAAGPVTTVVTNPDGQSASSTLLSYQGSTVVSALSIASISPAAGPSA